MYVDVNELFLKCLRNYLVVVSNIYIQKQEIWQARKIGFLN